VVITLAENNLQQVETVFLGQSRPVTLKRRKRSGKAQVQFESCPACLNRCSGWFCSLGLDMLTALESVSTPLSAASGQKLFVQGEGCEQVYILCGGFVKLTASSPQGRKLIVRIAGPGAVLGLHAAVSDGLYEVSAETLREVKLRSIRREDFVAFLSAHREMNERVVQCLCQEYRYVLQDACRIALTDSVAARLARLLIDLGSQIGDMSTGECRIPLLLTHEEIASMTCTTRETITRTLGQFRKDGILSIEGSTVTVHHPALLAAVV
jgi:CRP/FNR family transcriptional regulator, cyclic AMP receptor protein